MDVIKNVVSVGKLSQPIINIFPKIKPAKMAITAYVKNAEIKRGDIFGKNFKRRI